MFTRKANTVIDQGADSDVTALPDGEVRSLFAAFDSTHGGTPLQHEEPTAEQLGALADRLSKDTAPYTDMGLWGPYGRRQAKILKFQAQIWVGGELVT